MLSNQGLITQIEDLIGFLDDDSRAIINLFDPHNLDFINLLNHRELIAKKFHLMHVTSKINVAEKIAKHIANHSHEKTIVNANFEGALVLDTALRARNIHFGNQVNRRYSEEELFFIKIAHYLSRKSAHEVSSINISGKDLQFIYNYHNLFCISKSLQDLIRINQDLYTYLTGRLIDFHHIKSSHFILPQRYFQFITENLGWLENGSSQNIIIKSLDSTHYNADHYFFLACSYEEYYQVISSKFGLKNKQKIEQKIFELIFTNCFANQKIYLCYDPSIKKRPYLFEIIEVILAQPNEAVNVRTNSELVGRDMKATSNKLSLDELPRKIYVTAVEKLMRDPYLYYTENIMKIKRLENKEEELEKFFGIVLHEAFSILVHQTSLSLENFIDQFITTIDSILVKYHLNSEIIHVLWLPKFSKIAHWFWHYEQTIIEKREKILAEVNGYMTVNLGEVEIELCAKIDRIDFMKDGSINIIDYKSGMLPSSKDIAIGLAPQLPLEALIMRNGYINNERIAVNNDKINLFYINLTGRHNVGEVKLISSDFEKTLNQLVKLLEKFWLDDPCFFFQKNNHYLDKQYKHFVRDIANTL